MFDILKKITKIEKRKETYFMQDKKPYLIGAFLFSIFVELGFQTWWNKQWGDYLSPVVLLLAGISTCYFAYRLLAFEKETALTLPLPSSKKNTRQNTAIVLSVFAIGVFIVGKYYASIHAQFPVYSNGSGSDVIPSLQLYVKRFLAGEYAYQPLVFEGWTVLPTYFPMMWLPYCFSEILKIDYRWTAYLVFLIPIGIYCWKMAKTEIHPLELALKVALPFVMLYILMTYLDTAFGYGVEMMPIGLYFLLTLSLMNRSAFIMALPIVCVLLSRYAFTFWLPVYMLVLWSEKGFAQVFKVSLWVLAGVLMLYIIPFLSKDVEIFINGLKYYGKTAESAWAWQREDGRPLMLIGGFSQAIFFYDFAGGEMLDRLKLNRTFHICICFVTALGIFWNYWRNRKKGLNITIYLLITLKLYLVIFYGFFYVPFKYLFQLPLLLSLPLLWHLRFKPSSNK